MQLQTRPMLLAHRVYALLLRAYPAAFRQEYGYHMAQLFRDEMRDTVCERGTVGLLRLWFITFLDLVKTAAAEHIWEAFHMSLFGFSRRSGLAAILGAVLYYGSIVVAVIAAEFGPVSPGVFVAMIGSILLSLPLLALGLMGLYRRLPRGLAGGLTLAAAEVGLFLYIIGVVLLFSTNRVDTAMTMIEAGTVLLGLGLLGLGLLGLAGRTLGWWSIGPLLLGAGHIIFFLFIGDNPNQAVILSTLATLLVGWFLIGAALWAGPAGDRQPGLSTQ